MNRERDFTVPRTAPAIETEGQSIRQWNWETDTEQGQWFYAWCTPSENSHAHLCGKPVPATTMLKLGLTNE